MSRILEKLTIEEFKIHYDLLICDLDGTLRRCNVPNQPCPNNPDQSVTIPEVKAWFSCIDWRLKYLGFASNQGGISLNYISQDLAYHMAKNLYIELTRRWPVQGSIQICSSLDKNDRRRKPNPGMIEEILWAFADKRPCRPLFVGDMESDLQAARTANVDFIWSWDLFGFSKTVEQYLIQHKENQYLYQLAAKRIPDLDFGYDEKDGSWFWTYRCAESEQSFSTFEEALIDFMADQLLDLLPISDSDREL